MLSTTPTIPEAIFNFSGQSEIEIWAFDQRVESVGWSAFSEWLTHERALVLQGLRELVDRFPFYTHSKPTGRKPIGERVIMIGLLVRQLYGLTYRQVQGLLASARDFLRIDTVPN